MPYHGLNLNDTIANTTQSLPLPVGSVVAFLKTTIPTGFIICDGRTIQNNAPLDPDYYPQLVEYLNPGQTTAVVPDLRGQFLRGYSIDNSIDTAGPREPGTSQADGTKAHTHNVPVRYNASSTAGAAGADVNAGGGSTYNVTTDTQTPTGLDETRVKNIAVVWAIKASDTIIDSTIYSETDPTSLFARVTQAQKTQFNARLSPSAIDPLAISDGANTVYLTPYEGNTIWLYNVGKSIWQPYMIPDTSTTSMVLGGMPSRLPYDVFVYDNSGTLALERVAWTNNTTRSVTLTKKDGIYVKSGELNKRYVGTLYVLTNALKMETSKLDTGTESLEFSIINHYNKVPIVITRTLTANTPSDAFVGSGGSTRIFVTNNRQSNITTASTNLGDSQFTYYCPLTYKTNTNDTIDVRIHAAAKYSLVNTDPTFSQALVQYTNPNITTSANISNRATIINNLGGLQTFGLSGVSSNAINFQGVTRFDLEFNW